VSEAESDLDSTQPQEADVSKPEKSFEAILLEEVSLIFDTTVKTLIAKQERAEIIQQLKDSLGEKPEVQELLANQKGDLAQAKALVAYAKTISDEKIQALTAQYESQNEAYRKTRNAVRISVARAFTSVVDFEKIPCPEINAKPLITEAINAILVDLETTVRQKGEMQPKNFQFMIEMVKKGVMRDMKTKLENLRLKRREVTDSLTNLNKRAFVEEVIRHDFEAEVARGDKNKIAAFIMLDLDHFKRINDTYGHQIGDKVLIEFGEFLKKQFRSVDFVARWGGEEFAIYLPKIADRNILTKIVKRFRKAMQDFQVDGIKVTCSGGVRVFKYSDKQSISTISNEADKALYTAKEGGRNQMTFYYTPRSTIDNDEEAFES
jgi:diguanylate cyclase (GGDEF)-like protein